MKQRPDKTNYYLDIAEQTAKRGTCLRRNFGAIIVNDDQIVSTGYVGAPRGRENCCDRGECLRQKLNIPRGERYEVCRSVHAEANAIIHAGRERCIDATLYLVGLERDENDVFDMKTLVLNAAPCSMCKRMIINAGIKSVVVRDRYYGNYTVHSVQDWVYADDSIEINY